MDVKNNEFIKDAVIYYTNKVIKETEDETKMKFINSVVDGLIFKLLPVLQKKYEDAKYTGTKHFFLDKKDLLNKDSYYETAKRIVELHFATDFEMLNDRVKFILKEKENEGESEKKDDKQ